MTKISPPLLLITLISAICFSGTPHYTNNLPRGAYRYFSTGNDEPPDEKRYAYYNKWNAYKLQDIEGQFCMIDILTKEGIPTTPGQIIGITVNQPTLSKNSTLSDRTWLLNIHTFNQIQAHDIATMLTNGDENASKTNNKLPIIDLVQYTKEQVLQPTQSQSHTETYFNIALNTANDTIALTHKGKDIYLPTHHQFKPKNSQAYTANLITLPYSTIAILKTLRLLEAVQETNHSLASH